jgi:hypothetical protein
VSSFWITNPDNIYRDNVAAGSDSTGFWFAFPEHPTGKFEGTEISKGHLAASHEGEGVQGQRRPFELRQFHG